MVCFSIYPTPGFSLSLMGKELEAIFKIFLFREDLFCYFCFVLFCFVLFCFVLFQDRVSLWSTGCWNLLCRPGWSQTGRSTCL
ncbi:rCG24906 [Rattus norvegicus]|uniref:RCG24906 n=1 Tax=Rattus norvegicus TaxID=10116 RepID=A6JBM7_RAT|nr:rCG24906 [Rattus norvegicus]